MISQGGNCLPNCPHFPATIADFGLNFYILKKNAKKHCRKEVPGFGANPPSFGSFTKYTYKYTTVGLKFSDDYHLNYWS